MSGWLGSAGRTTTPRLTVPAFRWGTRRRCLARRLHERVSSFPSPVLDGRAGRRRDRRVLRTSSTTAPSVAPTAPASVAAPSAPASVAPSEAASPSAERAPPPPPVRPRRARRPRRWSRCTRWTARTSNTPIAPTPGTIITLRNLGTRPTSCACCAATTTRPTSRCSTTSRRSSPPTCQVRDRGRRAAADANTVADGQIVIDQPGDYAVVDFLPSGRPRSPASPDPAMAPGTTTNYSKGMFTSFTAVPPAS